MRHSHLEYVAGCFRCELNRDEAIDSLGGMAADIGGLVTPRSSLDNDGGDYVLSVVPRVASAIRAADKGDAFPTSHNFRIEAINTDPVVQRFVRFVDTLDV